MLGLRKSPSKIKNRWIRLIFFIVVVLFLIVCAVILLYYFINGNGIKGLLYELILDTLKVTVAIVISMLGFSVSIYVFLIDTLQTRKREKVFEKEVIDEFQDRQRSKLMTGIKLSICIVVLECLLLLSQNTIVEMSVSISGVQKELICYISIPVCIFFTFIDVLLLGHFTYCIVNYDDGLKKLALELRAKCEISNDDKRMDRDSFLNSVNNIEVLVDRLIENHLHAKISSVDDSDLERALCDGIFNGDEISERKKFSESYQNIVKYRNLLLQSSNLEDENNVNEWNKGYVEDVEDNENNGKKEHDIYSVEDLKNELFTNYLINELLTGISISNLKLSNVNLLYTSLKDSSLKEIQFSNKSNLQCADFRDCLLNGVKFGDSICVGSNFSEAKFFNLEFDSAVNFERSVFKDADLSGLENFGPRNEKDELVRFMHSDFNHANLSSLKIFNMCFDFASLCEVRLVYCMIGVSGKKRESIYNSESDQKAYKTSFCHADLTNANMLQCYIESSNFSDATLDGAVLTFAEIRNVDMIEARLEKATLTDSIIGNCHFGKAYCTNMSLKGSRIDNSFFNYATMIDVDVSGSILNLVDFKDAVCRGSLWIGCKIDSCDFERCVLENSIIAGESDEVIVSNCNYRYANLSNCAITNIEFYNCDFYCADLSDARLIDVKFHDCKNLDSVLTDRVWLSKVNFYGKEKGVLKEPFGGWRYIDSETTL